MSSTNLTKSRRYAVVCCGAVAAVLTPPDAVSMLLLLVPLYSLYEFAILAIRLTHWRANRKVAAQSNSASDEEEPAADVDPTKRNLGPTSSPGGGRVDVVGPI